MGTPPSTPAQVQAFLGAHPRWALEDGKLTRTFEAQSFVAAIRFVDEVARLAEAADHHPDLDIRWKRVTLRFATHDAGGQVTALDTRLAGECDLLFDAAPWLARN
jgi:4a-hydroxytetrahydrobiopterin dehydratase